MNTSYIRKIVEKALNEERLLAALSYIGPAFLFVGWRDNATDFDLYHADQGLALFAARLLARIVGKLPVVGRPISGACRFALNVLALVGIKNAVCGDMKPIFNIKL